MLGYRRFQLKAAVFDFYLTSYIFMNRAMHVCAVTYISYIACVVVKYATV